MKPYTIDKFRRFCQAALIALSAAGCDAYRSDFAAPTLAAAQLEPLAVVPFENLAAYPNAGLIVAELFQGELLASGRLEPKPLEKISALLGPLEGERRTPAELGALLGAKTLVLGRVTEYTYKAGLGEDPAVGVSVRLVDAATGRVLWSGARSRTGRYAWLKEDSLSRLAGEVCRELAGSLLKGVPDAGKR